MLDFQMNNYLYNVMKKSFWWIHHRLTLKKRLVSDKDKRGVYTPFIKLVVIHLFDSLKGSVGRYG